MHTDGLWRRLGGNLDRAKHLLRRAFTEDHTTDEIAESFGLGVFITMLPTLGTGFLLFVLLAAVIDRLSKLALLASAVVFNPVVKWGVYGASFALGSAILGPVDGAALRRLSLSAAPDLLLRLVVGNVVLAVVAAVPSYFVAHALIEEYGDSAGDRARRVLDRVGLGPETASDEGATE